MQLATQRMYISMLSTPGRTAGAVYKDPQVAQNLACHPKAERKNDNIATDTSNH
jgi:hypothetical protein